MGQVVAFQPIPPTLLRYLVCTSTYACFAPPTVASVRWVISTYIGYVGMYNNNIVSKMQPKKSCERRNAQYKMDNILFNYY